MQVFAEIRLWFEEDHHLTFMKEQDFTDIDQKVLKTLYR